MRNGAIVVDATCGCFPKIKRNSDFEALPLEIA